MEKILFNVTRPDKERWVAAARAEGVSLSEWLRLAARVRLEQAVAVPVQEGLFEGEPLPEDVLQQIRVEWNEGIIPAEE